jgi:hypothetical protein
MMIYRKPRTQPLPMLLTNNQRKMHGLPLHKKAGKGKRCKTRCEVMETVGAFLDYCNGRI